MDSISWLKSRILSVVDGVNSVVGGPQPFTRAQRVDPAESFHDDAERRVFIAGNAEKELLKFVSGGTFVQSLPNDMGDCAIWQGIYTAMTVLRWRSSQSVKDQAEMLAAATALSRYFYPTGYGASILVRGAMPLSLEHTFFSIDYANASRYFVCGHLGVDYVYREDASLDSLLGTMYGAAIVNRFGDDASRAVLTGPLKRFSTGFSRAGHKLTNRDGSPTTYGNCAPGLFQAPVRTLAATLPSLVSHGIDWAYIANRHAPEFETTDTQIPNKTSYVNAHLAILANLTYVTATQKGVLGFPEACAGLRNLLGKYSDAGNAFLIYGCSAIGVTPSWSQMDKAAKILSEFPLYGKPRIGLNRSVEPSPQPVPVWQRPPVDVVWQRSPYPQSGSDSASYNRMDYLLAHYLSNLVE